MGAGLCYRLKRKQRETAMKQYRATFANPGHSAHVTITSDEDVDMAGAGATFKGTITFIDSGAFSPLRHMEGVTRDFTILEAARDRANGAGPYLI